ncbi:MAG: DUF4149 domain-containing protein [Myxococcota bacterium]
MESIAMGIATVLVGTWIGAIIFHSAVVAPTVFRGLDEEAARSFLRTLFPKFFKLGLVCGTLTVVAAAVALAAGSDNALLLLGTAAGMTLLEGVSLAMIPAINAARDAGPAGAARFARLHKINVLLTVVILIVGLVVLYRLGA